MMPVPPGSDPGGELSYQSTYRRSEVAVPALFAVLALAVGGGAAVIIFVDGRNLETAIMALALATVLLLLAVLLTAFRVHRWTVRSHGIEILQRPRVPLTGLARRATVAFPDIVAFRRVEHGLDRLIEITTRNGRRFRLSQAMTGAAHELARPDPAADLDAFAASVHMAARRAGHALPAMTEGPGFWNSVAGLALLLVMFAVSLVLSGGVAWSLREGMAISHRPRGGEAIAILLLLPFGAGYLLLKSWRRRAGLRASPGSAESRRP